MFTEINLDSNISHVPSELLTSAIFQLNLVALSWFGRNDNQCSSSQLEAVLQAMVDKQFKESKLKKLMIGWIDITDIPSELLVVAMTRLDRVYFRNTTITAQQLHGIIMLAHHCIQYKQCNLNKILIRRPRIVGQLPSEFQIDYNQQDLVKIVW